MTGLLFGDLASNSSAVTLPCCTGSAIPDRRISSARTLADAVINSPRPSKQPQKIRRFTLLLYVRAVPPVAIFVRSTGGDRRTGEASSKNACAFQEMSLRDLQHASLETLRKTASICDSADVRAVHRREGSPKRAVIEMQRPFLLPRAGRNSSATSA